MTAAEAGGAAQPAAAYAVPACLQLSPVTWLRLRHRLAEAALAQGQLEACDDQVQSIYMVCSCVCACVCVLVYL